MSSSSESKRTFSSQQQANFAENSDNEGHGISICLPRVFKNIGYRRVFRHMREANLGFVERVDVVPVYGKDGTIAYKRAFVHFAKGRWNMRDHTARAALEALKSGKRIKIEYDTPWFWLAGISGAKRPDEAPKPYERKVNIEVVQSTEDSEQNEGLQALAGPAEINTDDGEHTGSYDPSEQPDEEYRSAHQNRHTSV